ncbi:MAG: threonine synthase [Clostridia bacterium]|nr:threonine synthase [Clostridia bacterium]
MKYFSTRNQTHQVSGCRAVISGIAPDGGLYLPCELPVYTHEDLKRFLQLSYVELAAEVLAFFFPEIGKQKLLSACRSAYAPEKFGMENPVSLKRLGKDLVMLELWHGPTLAFKDMALQLLPHLLTLSLEAEGDDRRALVLTATSGDTGKAALQGFTDVKGTGVAVFYPAHGVSEMQRLQMATHRAGNVAVFAIDGNFDDTQTAVKRIFADEAIRAAAAEKGVFLSSANSINIGRLLPQVVYYLYAWLSMVQEGMLDLEQPFDVDVPTGNFGNILAAWLAKQMGVPVRRLICASNRNSILTDFFNTGVYDTNRPFYQTTSPSMDILISSNLERLLFYFLGQDDAACAEQMGSLAQTGSYRLPEEAVAALSKEFFAAHTDDAGTLESIGRTYREFGYCIDPHTAVAVEAYRQAPDKILTLVAATASPYKFSSTVLKGLGQESEADEFLNLQKLANLLGERPPEALRELRELPVRFHEVFQKDQMVKLVRALF